MSNSTTDTTAPHEVSRRRVLKVAAWSTPVIAAAVAAPLAAASGSVTITAANGSGSSFSFDVVSEDDTFPLIFDVVDANGQPATGTLTATLIGAGGIVEWDGGDGSGTTVDTLDPAGQASLPLKALGGYGTFQVMVTVGSVSSLFSVTVSA